MGDVGHPPTVLKPGRSKNFLDDLSNSGPAVDYIVKAGQPARPNAVTGRRLSQEKEKS